MAKPVQPGFTEFNYRPGGKIARWRGLNYSPNAEMVAEDQLGEGQNIRPVGKGYAERGGQEELVDLGEVVTGVYDPVVNFGVAASGPAPGDDVLLPAATTTLFSDYYLFAPSGTSAAYVYAGWGQVAAGVNGGANAPIFFTRGLRCVAGPVGSVDSGGGTPVNRVYYYLPATGTVGYVTLTGEIDCSTWTGGEYTNPAVWPDYHARHGFNWPPMIITPPSSPYLGQAMDVLVLSRGSIHAVTAGVATSTIIATPAWPAANAYPMYGYVSKNATRDLVVSTREATVVGVDNIVKVRAYRGTDAALLLDETIPSQFSAVDPGEDFYSLEFAPTVLMETASSSPPSPGILCHAWVQYSCLGVKTHPGLYCNSIYDSNGDGWEEFTPWIVPAGKWGFLGSHNFSEQPLFYPTYAWPRYSVGDWPRSGQVTLLNMRSLGSGMGHIAINDAPVHIYDRSVDVGSAAPQVDNVQITHLRAPVHMIPVGTDGAVLDAMIGADNKLYYLWATLVHSTTVQGHPVASITYYLGMATSADDWNDAYYTFPTLLLNHTGYCKGASGVSHRTRMMLMGRLIKHGGYLKVLQPTEQFNTTNDTVVSAPALLHNTFIAV